MCSVSFDTNDIFASSFFDKPLNFGTRKQGILSGHGNLMPIKFLTVVWVGYLKNSSSYVKSWQLYLIVSKRNQLDMAHISSITSKRLFNSFIVFKKLKSKTIFLYFYFLEHGLTSFDNILFHIEITQNELYSCKWKYLRFWICGDIGIHH